MFSCVKATPSPPVLSVEDRPLAREALCSSSKRCFLTSSLLSTVGGGAAATGAGGGGASGALLKTFSPRPGRIEEVVFEITLIIWLSPRVGRIEIVVGGHSISILKLVSTEVIFEPCS